MPTLSIIMPVYNEARTLEEMLKRLGKVEFPVTWELIVVDDGSTDGATDDIRREWVETAERVLLVRSRENRGKGAALRRGFELASGEVLGVQDADLETDPNHIPALIAPIVDGTADVVFGARRFDGIDHSPWLALGNRAISRFASLLFGHEINDAYTCHKFFTREQYERVQLTADRFDIEAELTGKLLRAGARYAEVPTTYIPRSRSAGKKIRVRDGLQGVLRLLRVRFESSP